MKCIEDLLVDESKTFEVHQIRDVVAKKLGTTFPIVKLLLELTFAKIKMTQVIAVVKIRIPQRQHKKISIL